MSEQHIKIEILDRTYPLAVSATDYNSVLAAQELISKKLKWLQKQYAQVDKQDVLSMCLLQLASQITLWEHQQGEQNQPQGLTDIVAKLEQMLAGTEKLFDAEM